MKNLNFNLKGLKFSIPFTRKNLNKISEDKELPYNTLVNNQIYTIESNVRNDIFQSYLNYWNDGEIPQINSDNIWEYYQLSNEFGLLSEILSQPKFEQLFDLSFLIKQIQGSNFNKSDIEKKIALNLQYYLENFSDELKRIQINILYNIFYHQERNLNDQDLAYNFIIETAINVNEGFYILLPSLDICKFASPQNQYDSYINQIKHQGFCPRNVEKYFLSKFSASEKVAEIENKLNEALQTIKILTYSNDQLSNKVNKLENDLKSANQKIQKLTTENDQLSNKINEVNRKINENNSNQKKPLYELETKIDEFDGIFNFFQKKIPYSK